MPLPHRVWHRGGGGAWAEKIDTILKSDVSSGICSIYLRLSQNCQRNQVRGCICQIIVRRDPASVEARGPLPWRHCLEIYSLLSCHVYRCLMQCLNQSVLSTQLHYTLGILAITIYVFFRNGRNLFKLPILRAKKISVGLFCRMPKHDRRISD